NEPLMAMVSVPQQLKQTTQRPLADNTVRFVGEAVAAVLATSRESAVDAADGVRGRYDLLRAVIDPLKAHQRDAPQLHPHCRENDVGVGRERVGDPERAFAR